MNFIKTMIRETVNNAREISQMSPRRRDLMCNASAMLARSYMNDILRAADFVAAVTKNPSPEEVLKIVLPNTSSAINMINKQLADLDLAEVKKATEETIATVQATEAAVPPPVPPAVTVSNPYEFKINPKAWAPHGQSTNG